MIAFIEGNVLECEPTHLIVDVGGLGYQVNISLNTYSQVKDKPKVKIYTHLHVKEDSHTLYGFSTKEERQVFLQLISITGVGPSTGIMIQSSLTPQELFAAIVHENVTTIQSVKGIGGKTAQRIILELKDKMRKEGLEKGEEEMVASDDKSYNNLRSEALSALTTLGINKAAAEKSITDILRENGNEITLEELIKRALKST